MRAVMARDWLSDGSDRDPEGLGTFRRGREVYYGDATDRPCSSADLLQASAVSSPVMNRAAIDAIVNAARELRP